MKHLLDHFKEYGWCVLDLLKPQVIETIRCSLQNKLCDLLQKDSSLEDYHSQVEDDQMHTRRQT